MRTADGTTYPCSGGAVTAQAHVAVFPADLTTKAPACSTLKFVVRVPTEEPIPATALRRQIPAAGTVIAIAHMRNGTGLRAAVRAATDRIHKPRSRARAARVTNAPLMRRAT